MKSYYLYDSKTPPNTGVFRIHTSSSQEYKHWFRTFEYFLHVLPQEGINKLRILTNFLSPQTFEHISECNTYDLNFGGVKEPLVVGLATLSEEPLNLFENLTPDCKPIASKSRLYSAEDRNFISSEVQLLYKEGVIEPLTSLWRSQVVVTRNERSKNALL